MQYKSELWKMHLSKKKKAVDTGHLYDTPFQFYMSDTINLI